MRGVRIPEAVDGVIVCHSIDQVGNDLTKTLQWCSTHTEPVWVYRDGSYECPQTRVVQWDTQDHEIVAFPWVCS